MKIFALIPTLLFLASCAHHPVMTREEWQSAGQKTYPAMNKETLIKGAEKVLKLADGDRVKFGYNPKGFVAARTWSMFMVIAAAYGTDYWTFEVEEKDGKSIANVQISTAASSTSGYAGGGQSGFISTTSFGTPIQGTAAYDMFWERLDYVLGLRKDWPDCRRGLQKIKSKETWGDLNQICDSVTLNDSLPDNLSDGEIERIFKGRDFEEEANYLRKSQPDKWPEAKKKHQLIDPNYGWVH